MVKCCSKMICLELVNLGYTLQPFFFIRFNKQNRVLNLLASQIFIRLCIQCKAMTCFRLLKWVDQSLIGQQPTQKEWEVGGQTNWINFLNKRDFSTLLKHFWSFFFFCVTFLYVLICKPFQVKVDINQTTYRRYFPY